MHRIEVGKLRGVACAPLIPCDRIPAGSAAGGELVRVNRCALRKSSGQGRRGAAADSLLYGVRAERAVVGRDGGYLISDSGGVRRVGRPGILLQNCVCVGAGERRLRGRKFRKCKFAARRGPARLGPLSSPLAGRGAAIGRVRSREARVSWTRIESARSSGAPARPISSGPKCERVARAPDRRRCSRRAAHTDEPRDCRAIFRWPRQHVR
jgi:hypothetical protein